MFGQHRCKWSSFLRAEAQCPKIKSKMSHTFFFSNITHICNTNMLIFNLIELTTRIDVWKEEWRGVRVWDCVVRDLNRPFDHQWKFFYMTKSSTIIRITKWFKEVFNTDWWDPKNNAYRSTAWLLVRIPYKTCGFAHAVLISLRV